MPPHLILLVCLRPASTGGETLVADGRDVPPASPIRSPSPHWSTRPRRTASWTASPWPVGHDLGRSRPARFPAGNRPLPRTSSATPWPVASGSPAMSVAAVQQRTRPVRSGPYSTAGTAGTVNDAGLSPSEAPRPPRAMSGQPRRQQCDPPLTAHLRGRVSTQVKSQLPSGANLCYLGMKWQFWLPEASECSSTFRRRALFLFPGLSGSFRIFPSGQIVAATPGPQGADSGHCLKGDSIWQLAP
jgi:hypothetical protein